MGSLCAKPVESSDTAPKEPGQQQKPPNTVVTEEKTPPVAAVSPFPRREKTNWGEQYKVGEVLGKGSFGSVKRATDLKSGEDLALKLMLRQRKGKPYTRFWPEVDILSSLNHSRVMAFYDAFYDGDFFVLLTELLTGGALLDNIIKIQSYSEQSACRIFKDILLAIQYLHKSNIAHMDVKLENFVFSHADGHPKRNLKVIDFGLSQYLPPGAIGPKGGGTPQYMPPERFDRKNLNDRDALLAADMWAAGVVLFVLVTGTLPFNGPNRNAIVQSVCRCNYQFPYGLDLSKPLLDLIAKLMNPNRLERLTVDKALQHPWVNQPERVSSVPLNPVVHQGFVSCKNDTELKRALSSLLSNQLPPEQRTCVESMFHSFDLDKDGTLTQEELIAMVERYGYTKAESLHIARNMIAEFDLDKNNAIDLDEFGAIGARGLLSIDEKFVSELFATIDIDGDGYITRDEIAQYFSDNPNLKLEVDTTMILDEADLNRDGVLSKEEFLQAMETRQSVAE